MKKKNTTKIVKDNDPKIIIKKENVTITFT
jgi:hypothetical protein